MSAKEAYAALLANTDALYSGRSFDEFRAEQERIWREVERRPRVNAKVCAMLRESVREASR